MFWYRQPSWPCHGWQVFESAADKQDRILTPIPQQESIKPFTYGGLSAAIEVQRVIERVRQKLLYAVVAE